MVGHFTFYRQNKFYKKHLNLKPSVVIGLLVLGLHLVLIFLLVKNTQQARVQTKEVSIQFRLLQPDTPAQGQPSIRLYEPHLTTLPIDLKHPDSIVIEASNIINNVSSSENHQNDESTIFDPRLRKKLREAYFRAPEAEPSDKSWVDSSGTQFVEVSEGRCIRSMPNINASDSATNWSLQFKCGKNEGERMIDNINDDLAKRKKIK